MKAIFVLLLSTFLLSFTGGSSTDSNLKVKVEGIKNLEGKIGILVFNEEKGFPERVDNAILEKEIEVTSATMEIDLGSLPYGKYAIALIHDRNSNKILDKNFLGIPKEPFGFSNVERLFFGPPSFQEASIFFDEKNKIAKVKLLEI